MAGHNKLQVSIYASLRQVVGRKSIDLDLRALISVQELIMQILGVYPGLEAELVDDTGELRTHIHILVNGRDIR